MKNRITNNEGFTLIEMVMVIVILGILAAVAIPRFVDLQGSARLSTAHGITGALVGQITMLHAQKLIGSTTYDSATIIASIDKSGFQLGTGGAGILATLDDGSTYAWTFSINGGASVARGFQAAQVTEDF